MQWNLILALSAAIFARGSQAVDWASLRCPQDSRGTLPTPTFGSEDIAFTVCSEMVINKPWAAVYAAVLDFLAYPRWNSFVVDVQVPPNVTRTPGDVYVGMPMVFTTAGLIPHVNTTSEETVSVLDPRPEGAYAVAAWRYDQGLEGKAEHPYVLVDLGDGTTRQLSYESFYTGLATPLILLLRENLQKEFDRQSMDLKAYVEGR